MNAVNLYPKNYGELLEVAKVATCLTWFRSGQNLVLVIDDKPNDRRTIISCRVGRAKSGRVEITTLCGYKADCDVWTQYTSPQGDILFPNKRGLKTLLEWIRSEAIKQCAWIPNPKTLHIFVKVK
jgi:hypothetical protein